MPRYRLGELVELDGRTLEGGGQLLRIALCLSALTGTPVNITDIRGNRSGGGGLKAQHLACVNWLAHACNAKVKGAEKGSKTLLFEPGVVDGLSPAFRKKTTSDGEQVYESRLDIGTAGSTGLALQAILPFILFTKFPPELPVRLTLSGGTNVSGSPSYEYITQVLLPTLHNIGLPKISAKLGKRGWSHGGSSIGAFTLEIPPRQTLVLPALRLRPDGRTDPTTPSKPSHVQATFIVPASLHTHCRSIIDPAVQRHFGSTYASETGKLETICEGSLNEKRMYLILVATVPTNTKPASYRLGKDWLYDRRIRSHERSAIEMVEKVVSELAQEWSSGAWVDDHMRDQLIVFQALARGRSEVYPGATDKEGYEHEQREPSLHARTAEWVTSQMLGVKYDSEGRCEGIGYGSDATQPAREQSEDLDEAAARLVDAVGQIDLR